MKTVYKYTLNWDKPEIQLPKDAKILTVGYQGNDLMMWVEMGVDKEVEVETRNFHIFGTGWPIKEDMGVDYVYIGTAFAYNGLVFHVYERLGL
jgi:hypothetical protein